MRILTVCASPYLLTKLGRMNSCILRKLKEEGIEVASAVWHHDVSYFLPNNDGKYEFEKDNSVVCLLYPFHNYAEKNAPAVYDIIKDFNPDIVISIGDYTDTDFIFSIKALMPMSFKWISILAIDSMPINERRKEAFEFIDVAVVTSKMALEEIKKVSKVETVFSYFGTDHNIFKKDKKIFPEKDKLRVISCAKNSQSSGTASFIKGVAEANKINNHIIGYLHTNVSDRGDYDIPLLIERFDASESVILPDNFVGLNDGISDFELNKEYNKSDVIADLSVRSSTGLTVLEAMATGCIPLYTDVGAIGEIGKMLSNEDLNIQGNTYIGQFEEYYKIVSIEDFTEKLLKLYELKKDNVELFFNLNKESINISSLFSEDIFMKTIKDVIKRVGIIDRKVEVEIM